MPNDIGYENLAIAIVVQAYDDYKKALRRKDRREIKSIETFFYSDFCYLLTSIEPSYLINNAKREVRKKKWQKVKHGKIRQ